LRTSVVPGEAEFLTDSSTLQGMSPPPPPGRRRGRLIAVAFAETSLDECQSTARMQSCDCVSA
jgi:hypothetical protein